MTVAEKREATKARLLDAAASAVEAGGMAGLRVKDVARAAGCSLGQVYTFFEDVDALMVAVNSRTVARLDAHLGRAAASVEAGRPEEILASLAIAYLKFASSHRGAWSALFERAAVSGKKAPDWHRDEHLAMVDRIVRPLRDLLPDRSEETVAETALSMFSMVHGIVLVGLQETVVSVPVARLDRQLRTMVGAMCAGLASASQRDVPDPH